MPTPLWSSSILPAIEAVLSGLFPLLANALVAGVVSDLKPKHGTTHEAYWKALYAIPLVQGFCQAAYSIGALGAYAPDARVKEGITQVRLAVNWVRSVCPTIQAGLLYKCVQEGWDTPGTVSD
jgi:hypothetical protein